jgi:hypothetical protein
VKDLATRLCVTTVVTTADAFGVLLLRGQANGIVTVSVFNAFEDAPK